MSPERTRIVRHAADAMVEVLNPNEVETVIAPVALSQAILDEAQTITRPQGCARLDADSRLQVPISVLIAQFRCDIGDSSRPLRPAARGLGSAA
jgi:hypothetical protein